MSRQVAIIAIIISAVGRCDAYDMVPRWGSAAIYVPSPPSILISGGKTSSPDGTYSSSPNSADLIRLPLSSNFDTKSPPYELLNTSSPAPAYAWHTLSLSPANSSSLQAFLFGGDGGPSTPLPAGTDSSWFLSIPGDAPPSFSQQTSDWASQPQRRILHSAASGPGGMVYITGGQRNDGSGMILSDGYAFNPNTSTFAPLPNLPRGTAHHLSALLANGTLVVLGGIYTSSVTGNPTLSEMSTMYTLDTKSPSPAWWQASVGGTAPPARRGASGVMMADEKMYVLGGTGMSSAGAMADMWMLDMRAGSWIQVTTTGSGPPARFDHAALNIGGGQMYVFGGYGAGSPVAPDTYIFDTNTNAWLSSFSAPVTITSSPSSAPTAPPSTSTSPASVSSPASANSVGSSDQPSAASSTPANPSSTDASAPSSSSTESASAQATQANLSKGAQIGLALGVTMGIGILAAMVILLIRRRRAGYGRMSDDDDPDGGDGSPTAWLRPSPIEKDGQALLGDPRSGARPGEWSEKGGIVGLGLGAVGAGLLAARPNTTGNYHQLDDETGVGPTTKSTRRAGAGIKLIGPRSNPSAVAGSGPKSPPRVDMFRDEDSRTFRVTRDGPGGDWKVDRSGKDGWRSANTVLGHADDLEEDGPNDPFEDIPLIRGGPVPTPSVARSEADPFEDGTGEIDITTAVSRGPGLYQLPPLASSDPLDIAGLLAPRRGHDASSSLPRSDHSRLSTAYTSSDIEEGIVHHARFASQASASYSPPEEEYIPIKRNESFFRRMAAGGISTLGLMRRSGSEKKETVRRSESRDIRDPRPGPGPALWPVQSRDEDDDVDGGGTRALDAPPSSWAHHKGPSLSSIVSARSMRDMVIVQREGMDSNEASLVILEQEDMSEMGTPVLDGMSPVQYGDDDHGGSFGRRLDRSFYAEPSFFASPTEEDFDSIRPLDTSTSMAIPPQLPISTPGNIPKSTAPAIITTTSASPSPSPASGSGQRPLSVPTGCPLPKHLVEHRRPVKDMVFSINKRASYVAPVDPTSPTSQYSATPGATPLLGLGGGEGRGVSWQVRRRESLVVANPDKRGLRGGA